MAKREYTPVLGLLDDEAALKPLRGEAEVKPRAQGEAASGAAVELSVIVPARNEEARLGECLDSLLAQDDALFALGTDWELLLVDDASTDGTRALMERAAAGRVGVRVLDAPALDASVMTGKSNACWFAAQQARGRWIVFTDADTVHEPKDLLHAIYEAKKYDVQLLSYSPAQVVSGFWQRALMPLVFSELASVYRLSEINDPASRAAAANGQFVMVEREAYFRVGGHRALGLSTIEDVDLAWNVKRAYSKTGRGIRFRYAPDALRTRMYLGFRDMAEGWTKNLARLFPHALQLAAWRMLDIALWLLPVLLWVFPFLVLWQKAAIVLVWARTLLRYYRRVARSNFSFVDCAISPLALPLFVVLLVRSWIAHKVTRQVAWKGREYRA
jgi:glycosyltransferase involved in cell wall biosynthesis